VSDNPGDVVAVGMVPNVPIAEMIIEELRNEGIEAFFKSAGIGSWGVTSVTGPASPCEIYVQRADAERAKALLPS
jgi:sugar/nucleoside kinase (ribokinase family)